MRATRAIITSSCARSAEICKLLPALIQGLDLSQEDETLLYDLIGQKRQGVYPDLNSYIQNTELARVALRKARDRNIPDDVWLRIIDSIENG